MLGARRVTRIAHPFPFFDEAGIDLANHRAQVLFHLAHRVVLGRLGNGLHQHLMDAGEMPQKHALGALQPVIFDVIRERTELFEHFARDRFQSDVFLPDPGMLVGESVERRINEFAIGFRMFELLQLIDALLILHAFHFHLGHLLRLQLVQLFAQHDVGVFENGFDERDQIQRVIGRCRVEQWNGFEQIQRQRLVHRKILRQLDVDAQVGAVRRLRENLNDAPLDQ